MKKKLKKKVSNEEPSKPNKFALKDDLEEAEESEGVPVGKKPKKITGIVALRHKALLKKALGGKEGKARKSLYQVMIDQGYSVAYARSGGIKTKKSWQSLVEERLSEDKISNVHAQLIVAKKLDYMLFNSDIQDEDIYELMESVNCTVKKIVHGAQGVHVWFWLPDNAIRKGAIEMAYKVLGKFAPEKIELDATGLASLSDAELAARIKQAKDRFTKKD